MPQIPAVPKPDEKLIDVPGQIPAAILDTAVVKFPYIAHSQVAVQDSPSVYSCHPVVEDLQSVGGSQLASYCQIQIHVGRPVGAQLQDQRAVAIRLLVGAPLGKEAVEFGHGVGSDEEGWDKEVAVIKSGHSKWPRVFLIVLIGVCDHMLCFLFWVPTKIRMGAKKAQYSAPVSLLNLPPPGGGCVNALPLMYQSDCSSK